jgi:hypothetical protein
MRAAHAVASRPVFVLVLLALHAPRHSRSQFRGGLAGADQQPPDSGAQLGKLTDSGPQLGKLPGAGGIGGAAHAPGDDGKQAIKDMLQKQLGAQAAARGQAGAAAGAGAGAGLGGGDMSSFFKHHPAPAAPDAFEPSTLAPGSGGGSSDPPAGTAPGGGFGASSNDNRSVTLSCPSFPESLPLNAQT